MTTPVIQFKAASANVSRANDTIPTDDPDLLISLAAGAYAIWGVIEFDSNDTNAAKFGFRTSVVPTQVSALLPVIADNDTGIQGADSLALGISNVLQTDSANVFPGITTLVSFNGMLSVASAFDFALQWAQNTSKPDGVNRGKNSWFAIAPLN